MYPSSGRILDISLFTQACREALTTPCLLHFMQTICMLSEHSLTTKNGIPMPTHDRAVNKLYRAPTIHVVSSRPVQVHCVAEQDANKLCQSMPLNIPFSQYERIYYYS